MKNNFYNTFDIETYGERTNDYRTPFQVDRDRIIHSFSFRRLQAKTQVFFSGEFDFYRNRLTHSLEVSQIGRSIANYLKETSPYLDNEFFIDPELVEACCLSHDLGHPPFGHAGEKSLNKLMQSYGGFEGNAQTLRMLTETIYSSHGNRRGLNPTRAFMDGVLKYKSLYSQMEKNPENHFLYDDQLIYINFVFGGNTIPENLVPGKKKSLNNFKSIECQIMDWSDDTSYSLNDMVDSIKTGFINFEKLEKWKSKEDLDKEETEIIDNLLEIVRYDNIQSRFGMKIGEFIKATQLRECNNFMSEMSNRYRYELEIDPKIEKECNLYKKIAVELVFQSPQLSQLEYKGHYMLEKIFNSFVNLYMKSPQPSIKLLPKDWEVNIHEAKTKTQKARIMCDYIAGMTDRFATRVYKKLFDPDFGSIVDLV